MNNIQMIFGAPGTGKTTYLINLLRELLKEDSPDKIAFVSFTKKGSYEGRDRAIQEFGLHEKDLPYFRAIHSLAFRALRMSKMEMVSKKNYKEFSKAMGMNFVGYYTEDFVNNDDKYLFQVSLQKNNPEMAKKYEESLDYKKLQFVSVNYEKYKKQAGIIDFDDLLVNFIERNTPLPVDIAIIDEAQDLTTLQWEFCKVAFRDCKMVYIAGDDDQAIYGWSGADTEQFLEFTKHSSIKILDKSYRLKSNILEYSKQLTARIPIRVNKEFAAVGGQGTIQFYNRIEDIDVTSEETYYFLARNNYFLPEYKDYVIKMGTPFLYKGKQYLNKTTYEAIKKYEYFRKFNPSAIKGTLKALLKKDIVGHPPWYEAFEMSLEESGYYRDLFKNKADIDNSKITISTIHGVKGGEADNVVLMLDMTRDTSLAMEQITGLSSELRCLYVGITRAKKNLHIVYSKSRFGYDELIKSMEV